MTSRKALRSSLPIIGVIAIPVMLLLNTLRSLAIPNTFPFASTKATTHVPFPPSPKLASVFRSNPETCSQWIAAQKMVRSYLDAFIIGPEKSGTSELSRRLVALGARDQTRAMLKEWRFLYRIEESPFLQHGNTSNDALIPVTPYDIRKLRLNHFRSGNPDYHGTDPDQLPLIDDSPISERLITYDGTTEYLISERTAQLAQLVAPHARLLFLMRDPVERAISQYNVGATTELLTGAVGQPSASKFHYFVETEINALRHCGYDPVLAHYNGYTSELKDCVVKAAGHSRLYIFRGLYALHIEMWLRYFPAHRSLFVRFSEMFADPEKHLREVTRFLCIRDFPESLISKYIKKRRDASFGWALSSLFGAEDQYDGKDQNKFVVDVWDKTRQMMADFLQGSNRKLEWLLDEKCC